MLAYVATLALVSALFFKHVLPLKFVLFGFVAVVVFFTYSSQLTMKWERYPEHVFQRRVFVAALIFRLVYVVFIYYFYISETGEPYAYHSGDETFYHYSAVVWDEEGFEAFREYMNEYADLSDSGYSWWLAFI